MYYVIFNISSSKNVVLLRVGLSNIHVISALPVICLPACPASQTHKFLKRRTNLVLRASIWTKKITITIMAYVFSSLKVVRTGQMGPKLARILRFNQLFVNS